MKQIYNEINVYNTVHYNLGLRFINLIRIIVELKFIDFFIVL